MFRCTIGVLVLGLTSCTWQGDTKPSEEEASSQSPSTSDAAVPWTRVFSPDQIGKREYWLITTDIRQVPPTNSAATSFVIEADCVDKHLHLRESFRRYLPEDTRYLDYSAECTYQSSDLSDLESMRLSVVQSDGTAVMNVTAAVAGEKLRVETGAVQASEQKSDEIAWANDATVDLAMYFLITTLPRETGRMWKVPHYATIGQSLDLRPHVVECLGVDEKRGEPGNPWTQFAVYPRGQEDNSVRYFVSADGVLQAVQLDPFRRLVLKHPGEPPPQSFQPEARQRLAEMAQAYRSLPTYSVQGAYQIGSLVKGVWQEQRQPFSFDFVRPNRLHVNDGRLEITYDGSQMLECDHVAHDYTLREVTASVESMHELVHANTKSFELFNSPTGFPLFVLWELLTSDNAVDALQTGAQGFWLEPDRTLEGRRVHVIVGDWPEGCDNRIVIDAETKRIVRIELLQDPIQVRNMSGRPDLPEDSRLWWIPQQVLDEPPEEAFVTSAPAGYTALQPPAPPAPRSSFVDELYNAPAALRGQPMPDFEVTVLEANRQTRTLTKADLADRVTVMMLWDSTLDIAMPDLAELEHIVTASESIHGPLIFLAVSEDREPENPSELRDKIEEAVDKKGVALDTHENVLLALDPDWNVAHALNLVDPRAHVTPLLLIVDRRGIIRYVQVGISAEDEAPKDVMELIRVLCEENP